LSQVEMYNQSIQYVQFNGQDSHVEIISQTISNATKRCAWYILHI